MKILVLDNYDSFTYNLIHLVGQFAIDYSVARNDEISIDEIDFFDKILLSPGPGLPKDAGIMPELIQKYYSKKSILGVCLGLQAITEAFGGKLFNLKNVMHGRRVNTIVKDNEETLFRNLPGNFPSGRYHSWVADKNNFPIDLNITAVDDRGEVMALSHRNYDVKGIQFHPESIMTPHGKVIIQNWIET